MRGQKQWRNADIFRRIPKDLTEATTSGAIISIACIIIMSLLFFGEVVSYVFPRVNSDVVIASDEREIGKKMKVSLDMTFHKLPCEILSVDIIDVLHNHQVGSMKNIKSTRIDLKGKTIDPKTPVTPNEGCIIVGYIEVAKVPGNFHISSHTKPHEAARLFPEGINVEHTIRHLSFGSTNVKTLRKVAQLSPLDGRKGTSKRKNVMYQYFLEIIPTTYKGVLFSSDTYQFTSQMSKISLHPGHMPAVFFDYRLSPLSVQYSSGRVSFTHFLTYVCAIVGGVYTVCGLLSRFVHVSYAQIQKRMLGKGD